MSRAAPAPPAMRTNKAMTAALGFLMLDTRFPRLPGDAGCADSWDFPVLYHTVAGGTPTRIVREQAKDLLPAFIAGGQALAQQGVAGISTTCGFLCLHQQALARALPLPVMTSALLMAPQIIAALPPPQKLGILTVSAPHLGAAHLHAAQIPPERVRIGDLGARSTFAAALLNNSDTLDYRQAQREMVAAAQTLLDTDDTLAALLLECTNMPPYADAVRQAGGLPVYSIIDAVNDFYRSITAVS